MATSISSYIPTLAFSFEVANIKFQTDLDSLRIRIFSATTAELIYNTTIYSYSSIASISQVDEIIELHMRKEKRAFEQFSVYAYDDADNQLTSSAFDVIYCALNLGIDATTFSADHFLTTLDNKLIAPNSTESLFFYHGIEEFVIKFNCVFYDADNNCNTASFQWNNNAFTLPGVHRLSLKTDDLLVSLAELGYQNVTLTSFSVSVGQRYFSFYISKLSPDVEFSFYNAFNVPEVASFNAVTTAKTRVERSLANLHGKVQFYNQTTEKLYEVQTAPLLPSMAQWVEQLFMANDVRLGRDSDKNLPEVLITESTSDISDGAEPNRVKFTWRFVDDRLRYFFDSLGYRLFQQQFTNHFQ